MHLLKQTETMQTEVRVNYLNCHIHVPSNHVLANREANSRHTYDVTIWLSGTTDNSNIFIRSREVRDNESRLYLKRVNAVFGGGGGGGKENSVPLSGSLQMVCIFGSLTTKSC